MSAVENVRALVFDVFGTVVDWYSTIVSEGAALNAERGLQVDWGAFALAWRARYGPSMRQVMQPGSDWVGLDALHRAALDALLPEFGVVGLDEGATDHLNRVWHRLLPWPDTVPGLSRLKQRFVLGTLSNGNVALLVDMAKHAGLPWDVVFSAELVRAYKPDARIYDLAPSLLGLQPGDVMLVAAHQNDLRNAAKHGLRTAFVPRPFEYGPDSPPDDSPDPSFDLVAESFVALADTLGC